MRGDLASSGTMTSCQPRCLSRGDDLFRFITAVNAQIEVSGAKSVEEKLVEAWL